MPYVVLARRWRPQLFGDVVGQKHVTRTLQNAISSGRIAHAYLFSGPRGVGKTTVARILAKAINCSGGFPTPGAEPSRTRGDDPRMSGDSKACEPCEKCITCIEITAGRSIDVIEIDAASNRGIDEIRELRESVKFAPVLGKYKVYIIDEAHMLTIEAFNALLKTLEEPPGHVIFILATTEPYKIPATILSRCQQFDFSRLTRGEIVNRLREMAKRDNFIVDDESLSLIAESADGGMRDALSILDQLLSYSDGNIRAEAVSEILGLGQYHLLDELVENILKRGCNESLENLNNLADHGADLNQCLKKLVSYFRDLMVYKINSDLIDASETRLQRLTKQSEGVSIDRLMKIARILMQTESDIKQFGYERINFEMALVKLSRLGEDDVPLGEMLDKLEEIESRLTAGDVAVVSEPRHVYSEAAASIDVQPETVERDESDPVREIWFRLLGAIKEKRLMVLHAFLKEAFPVSIGEDNLAINFGPRFNLHREKVVEAENKKAIEAELSQLLSKPMKLTILAADSKNTEDPKRKTPVPQIDLQRDAREDKNVKLVLDIFNGRIVEVKQ